MSMRIKSLILLAALSAPAMMLGQKTTGQKQDQVSRQLSQADKMFLKALIQEDISEIGLAQLALQKTSDPDVKDYAQSKILAADPSMRDGAKKLAEDNGMTPPDTSNARQQKIHDELSQKSGKVFDNAYMNYEAGQQVGDVRLVNAELKATHNQSVKDYVTQEKTPVIAAAAKAKEVSQKISTNMTGYRQPDSGK